MRLLDILEVIPNNIADQFREHGCSELLIKRLSPNDNSKNQVYLGGSFEILSFFNFGNVSTSHEGGLRDRFKASLNFGWIVEGHVSNAPHTQLILYPKYPEVRLSGFLRGCDSAPSSLMNSRAANRMLFVSQSNSGKVIGLVTDCVHVNSWFDQESPSFKKNGIFSVLNIQSKDPEIVLFEKLRMITSTGWIEGKRLNKKREILPCFKSNCGGYTLESELGITPNGYSEPDFMGYEIKTFSHKGQSFSSSVLTLMTPEPTGGTYRDGLEAFIRLYGYPDRHERLNRWNFGGLHRLGVIHSGTNLKLEIRGFDFFNKKIIDTNGAIQLIDQKERVAAEWSFTGLIDHWARKHRKACYVPNIRMIESEKSFYKFSSKVYVGEGTDFIKFLVSWIAGFTYYDPALKVVYLQNGIESKRRNQFRIKFQHLPNLYHEFKEVELV